MKPYQPTDLEQEAISLVKLEKNTWEDATAFVTEKVAFQMRNLIRQLRKNYWGVFDEPVDKQTGRKKVWHPLSEFLVETVVKNIDLDTKDVNFKAKHPEAIRLTQVVRSIVQNYLEKIQFGELLDDMERRLAIDGTAVWKTVRVGKDLKVFDVDLLNIYIDPSAKTIQDAYRFTERSLMSPDAIASMSGWINTKGVEGTTGLPQTDSQFNQTNTSTSKFCDVWEMWGKGPKYLITGKKADKQVEVDLHIVVSGIDAPGKERVHLVETYDGSKPYEEFWYTRVPGRWYGKGVVEKVLMLQLYVNTILNIRLARSYITQMGLFKIRKGAGITPQMLSRLPSNGAIVVNSIDDIEQMAMAEIPVSSYKDEENAVTLARQVTAAFEAVTGEQLPSETSATVGAIQARNSQSQFTLIKEGIGMGIERWIRNRCIPHLTKILRKQDKIRLNMAYDEMQKEDEFQINQAIMQQLQMIQMSGQFVDPAQVMMEQQRALAQLQAMGQERYVNLDQLPNLTDYDVKVYITNEDLDKNVIAQNLLQSAQIAPELRGEIMKQLFDIMGLDIKLPKLPMMPGGAPTSPAAAPPSTDPMQSQMEASILNRAGVVNQ